MITKSFRPVHIVVGDECLGMTFQAAKNLANLFPEGRRPTILSERAYAEAAPKGDSVIALGGRMAKKAIKRLPKTLKGDAYECARGKAGHQEVFAVASPTARGILYAAWALAQSGNLREKTVQPVFGIRSLSLWKPSWDARALRPLLGRMAQLGLNALQIMDFNLDDVCLYPNF